MDGWIDGWDSQMSRVTRQKGSTFTLPHPVLEEVLVSAFFATEVNEEVCGSGRVLMGHVPHDPERVAGHLTNLDITGGGERGFHFCHLAFHQRIEKEDILSRA